MSMNKIKVELTIPSYFDNLKDEEFEILHKQILEHKGLIKSLNNPLNEFTGLIVSTVYSSGQIYGWLFNDTKNRAEEGSTIVTSKVIAEIESPGYENVSIVKTRNSKYLVINAAKGQ